MFRKDHDEDGSQEKVIKAPAQPVHTVEQHALDAGIGPGTKDHWQFAAARAMHGWAEGKELSAQEFADAVKAATTAPIR